MKLKRSAYSYVMMLGHLCADMGGGALPAILPFLVAQRGITYAQAAGLTFAVSSAGSLIQPLFGTLSDKYPRTWTMGVGVLLAGCGVSMIGFLSSYWMMFVAAVFTGIGSSMFHPDGGRMANYVSDKNKGKGISIFAVGGNMGFAIGPMLAVLGISLFGLKGTFVLAIPTLLMAVFLFSQTRVMSQFAMEGNKAIEKLKSAGQKDDWPGFAKLSGVILLRSVLGSSIGTFMPLFWVAILFQTQAVAGTASTILAFAGAVATLIGGRLADRYGFHIVIRTGLVVYVPLLILLTLSREVVWSTFLLIPLSMALNMAFSPAVALGQKLVPNHIGLASGVTMGLATSIGGMVTPLLGNIGDTKGLPLVMWILVGVATVAAIAAHFVPGEPTGVTEAVDEAMLEAVQAD